MSIHDEMMNHVFNAVKGVAAKKKVMAKKMKPTFKAEHAKFSKKEKDELINGKIEHEYSHEQE